MRVSEENEKIVSFADLKIVRTGQLLLKGINDNRENIKNLSTIIEN